jgi:catechol 2,3-dioxygenase-like lactoylglutathione lyase family enzyme
LKRSFHALATGVALTLLGATAAWAQSAPQTLPYDHIHVNVPDTAAAATWYEQHFGGRRITEAPDRIMFGAVRLMFLRTREVAPTSQGTAIDHIGFSVTDVDAKLKELAAAGAKVDGPAREVPNLFKLGFATDPWGTRLEIVQDPELLGLHHLHLRAPDPEVVFSWLLDKFGGERTKMKGQLDGIRYAGVPGFSTVWILVQRGDSVPSEGHAIDHIGWRSMGPIAETAAMLSGKGVTLTSQPSPLRLPNGPSINFFYVAGPAGAKIELVERPGLKPGE